VTSRHRFPLIRILDVFTTDFIYPSSLPHSEYLGLGFNGAFQVRWATKTAGGTTKNGRSSKPKHLGMKISDGQLVTRPGVQIFRQRGTQHLPGYGVGRASDDTLFSLLPGRVRYRLSRKTGKSVVSIEPLACLESQLIKTKPDGETKWRLNYHDADEYLKNHKGDPNRVPSRLSRPMGGNQSSAP